MNCCVFTSTSKYFLYDDS